MAIRFDGVNQYLNLGRDLPFINNRPGATIMAWVKMNRDQAPTVPTICGVSIGPPTGADTGSSRLSLEVNTSLRVASTVRALDTDAGSGILPPVSPAVQLTLGQWHHAGVTVDFTTRAVTLFKDGVAVYASIATSATAGNSSATNARNCAVGANEDGLSGFIAADIEDVRIYNRAVNEIEFSTIFAGKGMDGIVEQLVLRMPLKELGVDQLVNSTVADLSTTQRSGVGVNNPVYSEGVTTPRKRPKIPLFRRL